MFLLHEPSYRNIDCYSSRVAEKDVLKTNSFYKEVLVSCSSIQYSSIGRTFMYVTGWVFTPVQTTEEELGIPWMLAVVGVPLMALKMCRESGRGFFITSSTGEI